MPACGSWAVCGSCVVCVSRAMWGWQGPCVAGKVDVWLARPACGLWPARGPWAMSGWPGPFVSVVGRAWLVVIRGWLAMRRWSPVAGEPGVAGRPYCISGATAADRPCVARGLWAMGDVACGVSTPCLSGAPWLCDSPFLACGLRLGAVACVASGLVRLGGRVWRARLRSGRLASRRPGRGDLVWQAGHVWPAGHVCGAGGVRPASRGNFSHAGHKPTPSSEANSQRV